MTHQCNECPNFTDGKCCHETKICLSNSAKNETQTDLSIESGSQFKVGDIVVYINPNYDGCLLEIIRSYKDDKKHKAKITCNGLCGQVLAKEIRHAEPEEIKAGHRIDKLSNTLETLEEVDLSPNCVVGGDQ